MPSDIGTGPHRTHPLTVISGFAVFGTGLMLQLATQGIGFETAITLFGALQMLQWWFKTYEVGSEELIVREGVLRRRQHLVPYRRVQQVDVRRSLLMQVFGLAALTIETAGSQSGSVNLALLDLRTAERVRTTVLARRDEATRPAAADVVPVAGSEAAVFEIDGGLLALAGALSSGPVLLASLAVAFTPVFAALAIRYGLVALPIAVAAVLVVVVLAGFAAIATVLTYGGYRLAIAGDELRLTHGILDKKHVTVPRARVQHIQIVDNPLQRALGYASIHVRSAATLGRGTEGTGRLDIPILRRDVIPEFLAGLMGDRSWTPPPLRPRPAAARRRAIVRRAALLAAPALAAAVVTPVAGLVSIALLVVGMSWGEAAHRRAGSGTTPTVAAFAAGVVVHQMHLVPIARIQSARTTQSPFQRRSNLATIALDIAGTASAPALYDAGKPEAHELRLTLPLASRPHASTTISPVMP